MCGISGFYQLQHESVSLLSESLKRTNQRLKHRGPDGEGVWSHGQGFIGFGHTRLSIIDVDHGAQPMGLPSGMQITFNGEIYNYKELRRELGEALFQTQSDTEVILRAYERWGEECVTRLRGMFAFALWDEREQKLFCARDRFGIKPFVYFCQDDVFGFASEAKALLPFLHRVRIHPQALSDYLAFQFTLSQQTLFEGIEELPPAHVLVVKNGVVNQRCYWNVPCQISHSDPESVQEGLAEHLQQAIHYHLRSDVALGGYVSGGLDSSLVSSLAHQAYGKNFQGYHGYFSEGEAYDESHFAHDVAQHSGFGLQSTVITAEDFVENITKILYHLDTPLAGPGSFPQFMVSRLAAKSRKVVLGGQGGDEIFAGYARYLIACPQAWGLSTKELANSPLLSSYQGLVESLVDIQDISQRYGHLINRMPLVQGVVTKDVIDEKQIAERYHNLFLTKAPDLNQVLCFDLKTLLPALLHVEDRMSMAHGLEARVPLLDHKLVEYAFAIDPQLKCSQTAWKPLLREQAKQTLPQSLLARQDKMGFPVPLTQWLKGELHDFVFDVLGSQKAAQRGFINNRRVLQMLEQESTFGRSVWGALCLELWQVAFLD